MDQKPRAARVPRAHRYRLRVRDVRRHRQRRRNLRALRVVSLELLVEPSACADGEGRELDNLYQLYYAALGMFLYGGAEWRELLGVQDDLEDEAVRRAYGLLERAFADSIERHEAQHRLDFGADVLRAPSPRLDERLGAPTRADGGRDRRAWHRRAERDGDVGHLQRRGPPR